MFWKMNLPTEHSESLQAYGQKYQFRLLYFVCSLSDFGQQILPHLTAEMFDQPHHKQLVTLIRLYWEKYSQLPNADNLRLMMLEKVSNPVDQNILHEQLDLFVKLRAHLADGRANNDSQQVQELAWNFIRERALRAIKRDYDTIILTRDYARVKEITHRMQDAMQLGHREDIPVSPLRVTRALWENRYPGAVPTGIPQWDAILPGGLPPGKLGMFLMPQGVGKSSILSLIGDNVWAMGYRVLHIIFDENDPNEITLKYHAKWSGIRGADMKDHLQHMEDTVLRITEERKGKGDLAIRHFSSENMTVRTLKTWIQRYEERWGIRFDLILLDYIDELSPESRARDSYQGETEVVKAYHSMLVELNRPGWTATQAKKESNDKRLLYFNDCGGAVAKLKKAQVVITGGADNDQRDRSQINFVFLKSNISRSGQIWEDCYFDRDRLILDIKDPVGMAPVEELRAMYEKDELDELAKRGQLAPELLGILSTAAKALAGVGMLAQTQAEKPGLPVEAELPETSTDWARSFPASTFEDEPAGSFSFTGEQAPATDLNPAQIEADITEQVTEVEVALAGVSVPLSSADAKQLIENLGAALDNL